MSLQKFSVLQMAEVWTIPVSFQALRKRLQTQFTALEWVATSTCFRCTVTRHQKFQ